MKRFLSGLVRLIALAALAAVGWVLYQDLYTGADNPQPRIARTEPPEASSRDPASERYAPSVVAVTGPIEREVPGVQVVAAPVGVPAGEPGVEPGTAGPRTGPDDAGATEGEDNGAGEPASVVTSRPGAEVAPKVSVASTASADGDAHPPGASVGSSAPAAEVVAQPPGAVPAEPVVLPGPAVARPGIATPAGFPQRVPGLVAGTTPSGAATTEPEAGSNGGSPDGSEPGQVVIEDQVPVMPAAEPEAVGETAAVDSSTGVVGLPASGYPEAGATVAPVRPVATEAAAAGAATPAADEQPAHAVGAGADPETGAEVDVAPVPKAAMEVVEAALSTDQQSVSAANDGTGPGTEVVGMTVAESPADQRPGGIHVGGGSSVQVPVVPAPEARAPVTVMDRAIQVRPQAIEMGQVTAAALVAPDIAGTTGQAAPDEPAPVPKTPALAMVRPQSAVGVLVPSSGSMASPAAQEPAGEETPDSVMPRLVAGQPESALPPARMPPPPASPVVDAVIVPGEDTRVALAHPVPETDRPIPNPSGSASEWTLVEPGVAATGPFFADQYVSGEWERWRDQARQAAWQGNLAMAERLLRKFTAQVPGDYDALGELGNVLYAQRRWYEAAEVYYEAALHLASDGYDVDAIRLMWTVKQLAPQLGAELEQTLMGTGAAGSGRETQAFGGRLESAGQTPPRSKVTGYAEHQ